jgi:nucleotide-binding universal stress UspA family protein
MKTSSIGNILVPIDFSPMSIQAIQTAKAFARRFKAAVHLAHVHQFCYQAGFTAQIPPVFPYPPYYDRELEKNAARELILLAKKHGLSPSTTHLLVGAPAYDEICRLARKLPADLIVMPTHGRTGLEHAFLGSTAERIVRHSPCPVLVARERTGAAARGINKILVPVDYSKCSLAGLRYAIEFAKKVAARVMVLHVVDLGPQLMTEGCGVYHLSPYKEAAGHVSKPQMRAFLRGVNFGSVPFKASGIAGFCPGGICRAAEKEKADLIIMSTHGRTGLKHVLIGSIAERVVQHAPCAVLVVPSHPAMRAANVTKRPAFKAPMRSRRANTCLKPLRRVAGGSPQEMRGNSQLLRSVKSTQAQKFEHEDNSYTSADERQ